MGIYLNPGNQNFNEAFNKEIYVDKSLLIRHIEYLRNKINKYVCVSRPRRFGKSTDADMLIAYYSKDCDSHAIFDTLKISQTDTYAEHLNKHNVIHINMQSFLSNTHNIDNMIQLLTMKIMNEFKQEYSVSFFDETNLSLSMEDIYVETEERFIFIIDEWDCIFREYKQDKEAQKQYSDFLRDLLKDKPYVELAYMTGILPVKKFGTHSSLNMFEEISMIDPGLLSQFMGFTEAEVQNLCAQYNISYAEMQQWYDRYHLRDGISTFSRRSVIFPL